MTLSSPACSRSREGTSCQFFFGFFGTGASMIIQGLLNVLGNRGRDNDDAPDAAPPPATRSLLIVAADVHFKIKEYTRMRKVFYAYAARKGVAVDSLRFLFKGSRVRGDQTASEIGLANGDQLDVENHPMIYHADIHGCTGPGFGDRTARLVERARRGEIVLFLEGHCNQRTEIFTIMNGVEISYEGPNIRGLEDPRGAEDWAAATLFLDPLLSGSLDATVATVADHPRGNHVVTCTAALMALGAGLPPMEEPAPRWFLDLLVILGFVNGYTADTWEDTWEAECAVSAAVLCLGGYPPDVPLDFTRRLAVSVLGQDDVTREPCTTILNTRREAAWARTITAAMRDDDSTREYHAIVGAGHLYPARARTPDDTRRAGLTPSQYVMRGLSEWDDRIPGPRLTELLPGKIVG